jgi:hypothetical protein
LGRDVQRCGDPEESLQSRLPLTAFEHPNVRSIELSGISEILL